MADNHSSQPANSVLVIGGGIAGIKASLDLAEAGRRVYVIDKAPALGGFVPLLDRQFPTNDCQICYLRPESVPSAEALDIQVLPLTTITKLAGEPGAFTALLETTPRYIDITRCSACGACLEACDEGAVIFTPGLDHQSPTCMRYPQAVPTAFSIDRDKCTDCGKCLEVCEPDAIVLDQAVQSTSVEVGSVILATGAEMFDASALAESYGYGVFDDVITSLELERIMSPAGPSAGEFVRPSDGKRPQRIGWIQCAGSRTMQEPGNPYCSSVCCMFAMKEAVWATEHFAQDLEATIFFMDMRPMGKDYEQYYQRVKSQSGVQFIRCRPHTVTRDEATGDLLLSYVDDAGQQTEAHLDLVVLATGFCAPADAPALAQVLGVELDQYRFVASDDFRPVATSRPGVYACGMALGPRDIPDSIVLGSAAACLASGDLARPRVLAADEDLPPERDTSGQEPRVGIFFADWGRNVRSVVDLDQVSEAVRFLPSVVHVAELELSAGSGGLDNLVRAIGEHELNRVVVAGYSPRTHGRLFAETVRRAGLNRAMVSLANIRDQVALVHADDPAAATAKAVDLIKIALGEVLAATPIGQHRRRINHDALVVGGGVAGMSAALALADQGQKVYLVERAPQLGGLARKTQRTLDGQPVAPFLDDMVQRVTDHEGIQVITDALVVEHRGTVGAFTTSVQSGPGMYFQEIEHGVTILAAGGKEYRPDEFFYGRDPRVMTQLELGDLLAAGDGADDKLDTVVMIQCVGSRNQANPACGRICCRSAVKNALWLKELRPDAQVIVLYRDMRMPYRAEDLYRQAREQGVLFVRYSPDDPPQVALNGEQLTVTFTDKVLDRPLRVEPSALVLSTPQVVDEEATEELAEIFHLQQGEGGFLLEEHVKVRPVDTPAPGIFAAGSLLSPKSLDEARTQGLAAAGRALTLLAQESLSVSGSVAKVKAELCAACLVCVRACPVGVPFINADGYSEIDPDKCLGCGVCAAECPAKAIELQGFSDDQILGGVEALLQGVLS